MKRDDLSELFIPDIKNKSGAAQYIQLYRILETYIIEGKLSAGSKLPASRPLSISLKVSRNTVKSAYELLHAEGYIESKRGSGSYVVDTRNTRLVSVDWDQKEAGFSYEDEFSDLLTRLCKPAKSAPYFSKGSLAPATPAVSHFPWGQWQKAVICAARETKYQTVGTELGHPALREQIASYLQISRGVKCNKQNIILFSGSQQAIYFALQLLINPKDSVLVENPSYYGIDGALNAIGAIKVPVEIDSEGFKLDTKLHVKTKVAVITPSRNYPLGYTLSFNRRLELLKWAQSNRNWIIEDDYDSEFSFDDAPLTCLQGLSSTNRVIYAGTFSRILHHSIRIGYLVVPDALVNSFSLAKKMMHGAMPTLPQLSLEKFMASGDFSSHVKRMRKLYSSRRKTLQSFIKKYLPVSLTLVESDGGMHCVYWLKPNLNESDICEKAHANNIAIQSLSSYYSGDTKKQGLVIGFAGYDSDEQEAAIIKLAGIINDCVINQQV